MTGPGAAAAIAATVEAGGPVDDSFVAALADVSGLTAAEVRTIVRAAARTTGHTAPGMEIRTGAWRLDVSAAVAKAVACGAVTTVLLRGLGGQGVPATVLSIVAPFLFELERVEVAADDLVVHARLVAAAGHDVLHLPELYERLPSDVRAELSVREFAAVVERLLEARLISAGADGVRVRSFDHAKGFRLLLR